MTNLRLAHEEAGASAPMFSPRAGCAEAPLLFPRALRPQELVYLAGAAAGQPLSAVIVAGLYEAEEQRMRLQRLRLEFRVELAGEKVGMRGQLNDLHVGAVRRAARDAQSGAGQQLLVFAIELVAMAMTFVDLAGAVG